MVELKKFFVLLQQLATQRFGQEHLLFLIRFLVDSKLVVLLNVCVIFVRPSLALVFMQKDLQVPLQ